MSTWYKTENYGTDIKPVDVVSETEAFVIVAAEPATQWNKNPQPRRARKDGGYHRTFTEARQFLMNRTSEKILRCERELSKLRDEMGDLFTREG
jgi:hypothetical protein